MKNIIPPLGTSKFLQQVRTFEDYEPYRITKEKYIPRPKPMVTIAGSPIACADNITGISAASKAGKTAFTGVILAGAISTTGDVDGFNDLQVEPNYQGKAVIHLDSEQSKSDQQDLVNTILKRAKFENTPDYYLSYNIRENNLDNYKDFTDNVCSLSTQKYGGIHLIVLDGGADYIESVNDEKAAREIVRYFTQLSISYCCPVIIIVHLNPGSEKERGHFGSEVQRKCYGLMTIIKEGDISTAQPKFMRKAGNGDIPLLHFTYCKEKGYHIQVDSANIQEEKTAKGLAIIKKMAVEIFAPPNSFTHTEAIERIMLKTKKGESTAKTMLKNMKSWGILEHGEDRRYRLIMDDIDEGSKVKKGQY